MKFDVLNLCTKHAQFTAEIDCAEDTPHSIKMGLAVVWGHKNGANLNGANLNGVNGINEWLKCIQIDTYAICYTAEDLQIGCERHTLDEWQDFDAERIVRMDGRAALKFWLKYKDWIFATIKMCPATPTGAKIAGHRGIAISETQP